MTTQNLPIAVIEDLMRQEVRLGVSKTALTAFAIRTVKLRGFTLVDIKRDIEKATEELKAATTDRRKARWKPTLDE